MLAIFPTATVVMAESSSGPSKVEVDFTIDTSHRFDKELGKTGNDYGREEWFRDQALGMFVHWNLDCQIGTVNRKWANPIVLRITNVEKLEPQELVRKLTLNIGLSYRLTGESTRLARKQFKDGGAWTA